MIEPGRQTRTNLMFLSYRNKLCKPSSQNKAASRTHCLRLPWSLSFAPTLGISVAKEHTAVLAPMAGIEVLLENIYI